MAVLRAVAATPETHAPHRLHGPDRVWPETNCYLDLWIGLLHATGRDPLPLLGVAAAQRWEGDHFTFLKPHAGDIRAMTGAVLQELALWDRTEAHVATQLARGCVPLLEVDAWFLPDTAGTAYRLRHTKTTIAVAAMDAAAGWLEYFHNAGLFRLEGADYRGVLGCDARADALFPFAETVRLADPAPDAPAQRGAALAALGRLAACGRGQAPLAAFAADLPALLAGMAGDHQRIHAMCFNSVRQLGAGHALLADHLDWLGLDGAPAARLAELAKTLQFRLSRAARKGAVDPALDAMLAEMGGLRDTVEAVIAAATSPGLRMAPAA